MRPNFNLIFRDKFDRSRLTCELAALGDPTKQPHRQLAGPDKNGAPCRIRTCGLRIRNPMLYPTELRGLFRMTIISK